MKDKEKEYDSEFFKRVGSYDKCKARDRVRAECLIESFKPESVLDLGCGYGTLVDWLNGFGIHAIGVDISDYGVKFSKKCFCGDISNLDLNEKFDLVVGFDILEHIDENLIDQTIKGIAKVCNKHAFFNIPLTSNRGSLAEPTHVTIKPRQFWIEKFSTHFNELECTLCPTLVFKDAQFALKRKGMKIAYFCLDKTRYEDSLNEEILQSAFMAQQGHDVSLFIEGQVEFKESKQPETLEIIDLPIVKHVLGERQLTSEELKLAVDIVSKCDIIFGSSISSILLILAIKKLTHKKTIVQILDIPQFRLKYEHWFNQWFPWLQGIANCDLLITNTKRAAQDIHDIFKGRLDEKTKTVYYGINHPVCDSVPEQEKEYDVCVVGRLVFYKYFDLLLYALAKLKQDYGLNPKTVIIGEGEKHFEWQETSFNAEIDVTFAGAVSDKQKFELIKKSKIGVYPDCCDSISGLFPAEAMYCGLPVIIMDMPINRERFGDIPIYIPKFDVQRLAESIKETLEEYENGFDANTIKRGKDFVKNARLHKHTAKGILDLMEELVKRDEK